MPRVFGVSAEVACHRSTHSAHSCGAPSMAAGPVVYSGAGGGAACPSAARARWMPYTSPDLLAPMAGSARSRASVSSVRSSSSGLRLSSSIWQMAAVSTGPWRW